MPKPAPAMRQFWRCSGEACSRRGYQASGTEMERPSTRSTVSRSSLICTSLTRSPALGSEVATPGLPQQGTILGHDLLDAAQLASTKAQVVGQAHGLQPELGRAVVSVHVDVRRLVRLMRV